MGKVEEGIKVLDDMVMGKFNFCTPDNVTLTTIISGLLTVGKTQEALDVLLKVMPEKSFHLNVITYNVVLCGLFKLLHVIEAMKVFNSMIRVDVVADSTTHAIMIDGLCECDQDLVYQQQPFFDPSFIFFSLVSLSYASNFCSFSL
ncbi:Pentatricopeptide repeat-containing protein [Artemisia annua]|uniref:Pentatricopeptide repeat-containing protein n=1 Tax=Artemisia annua TaxID=35608 RepID=A0A2U1KP49_ARTAN|nr:Pentatricopeptide repeat-containing protein [Artemisia annua]